MLDSLWTEKYRPKSISDYVFMDESQKNQISSWIAEKTLPHLLLSGLPGTGKTTLAKVLFNELEIPQFDILEINASRENNVDTVRDKIINFVQVMPFGAFRVVLLDECLDEDTLVTVLRKNTEIKLKIKELNGETDLVKSFNTSTNQVEWKQFKLFDKGIQETLTIEFDNGEVVVCTPDHKWYTSDENGNAIVVKASELVHYMHILTHGD